MNSCGLWDTALNLLPVETSIKRMSCSHTPVTEFRGKPLAEPQSEGIRVPCRASISPPEQVKRRGYFDPDTITELSRDLMTGRLDYSLHPWALISFEEWHRQYLDSTPEPPNAKWACQPAGARQCSSLNININTS